MSLFNSPAKGDVSVRIQRVWIFWIWTVVYDTVPILFDRMGVVRTQKKALDKTIKHVQRIVRYEKQGETGG